MNERGITLKTLLNLAAIYLATKRSPSALFSSRAWGTSRTLENKS